MPLYEFVLRVPGRRDEVRISDHGGVCEGEAITIGGRGWIVAAREPVATERLDRVRVEGRIVVVRRTGDQ